MENALDIEQAAVFATSAGVSTAIRFVARYRQRVSGLVLLPPVARAKPLQRREEMASRVRFAMSLP